MTSRKACILPVFWLTETSLLSLFLSAVRIPLCERGCSSLVSGSFCCPASNDEVLSCCSAVCHHQASCTGGIVTCCCTSSRRRCNSSMRGSYIAFNCVVTLAMTISAERGFSQNQRKDLAHCPLRRR